MKRLQLELDLILTFIIVLQTFENTSSKEAHVRDICGTGTKL